MRVLVCFFGSCECLTSGVLAWIVLFLFALVALVARVAGGWFGGVCCRVWMREEQSVARCAVCQVLGVFLALMSIMGFGICFWGARVPAIW